jgi:hypothetical protein
MDDIEKLSLQIQKLHSNRDFQDIIVTGFIGNGIFQYAMQDVDNERVRDQLKARKILSDYFSDIINQAEIAKQEKE